MPLLRAELRAHSNDMCKRSHDKDNRILLRFPPLAIKNRNVCIINVSPSLRFTTHLYMWELDESDGWIFLISYRNHMRLARPPCSEAETMMVSRPTSVSFFKGWGNLLDEEGSATTVSPKALTRCPLCQEKCIRLPIGAQGTMVGRASIKESHQSRSL